MNYHINQVIIFKNFFKIIIFKFHIVNNFDFLEIFKNLILNFITNKYYLLYFIINFNI